jgi:glutamyl/glutaminyl-tRNA synthetase
MEPGLEPFDDAILGPQAQEPARQCGDLLARDRLGNWTYQFAVTVDDVVEGITDVIRGRDLLSSTGRQIRLARLLGRAAPPRFHHHPLILGPDGEKLSKSRGDAGLGELRDAGVTPAEAIARATALAGWSP